LCARAGSPGKVLAKETAPASARSLLIERDRVSYRVHRKSTRKNEHTSVKYTGGERGWRRVTPRWIEVRKEV